MDEIKNFSFKNINKNLSQSYIQHKPTQKQIESTNLIEEVKKRPELWCKSKTNPHKTREIRSVIWNNVIAKLGIESIEEGKRRWEILRDIFRRELKKGKIPNSNEYKSTWYHFNEMMFLTDIVQTKEPNLNLTIDDLLVAQQQNKIFEKEQHQQQQQQQQTIKQSQNIKTYENKKKLQQIQQQQNKNFEDYINNAEIKSEQCISDEEENVQDSVNIIYDDNTDENVAIKKVVTPLPYSGTLATNSLSVRTDHLNKNVNLNIINNEDTQLNNNLIENQQNKQNPTIKCKSLNQLTEIKIKKKRKLSKPCSIKSRYSSTSADIISLCDESESKKLKKSIDLNSIPIITQLHQPQPQTNFIPSLISENSSVLDDGATAATCSLSIPPIQESNNLESNYDLHKKMIESSDYHFAMSLIPFMKTVTESNKLRMRMRLVQVLLEENLRTE